MLRALLAVFLLFFVLISCKKEETTEVHKTTPFTFILPPGFPQPNLPSDNPLTEEGIALGRKLFYDPVLSVDSTQSCATCHKANFGFSDRNQFSFGVTGAEGKRNSMAVFNLAWHNQFFWDGRAATIRQQVLMPIEDPVEMNHNLAQLTNYLTELPNYKADFKKAFGDETINETRLALALEQFLLILVSGNSKFDSVTAGLSNFTPEEERGRLLFFTDFGSSQTQKGADCFHCHGNPLFLANSFKNNGLDATFTDLGLGGFTGRSQDNGKFKTTTLRNIELTAPYMHDGRFQTLREVIDFYNSGVQLSPTLDPAMHSIKDGLNLTEQEKNDLEAFLKTLTDRTLATNPMFANPF